MKAYVVQAKIDDMLEDVCVVLADSPSRAKTIAIKEGSKASCWDYTDLRCHTVDVGEYVESSEDLSSPKWLYDIQSYDDYIDECMQEYWSMV